MIDCQKKIIIYGSAIILLIVYGFWGDNIICFLKSRYMLQYYPEMIIQFITLALGIPAGLFVNSLVEKKKNKRILINILTFIKMELVSNNKNIESLQKAAEKISSFSVIKQEDLEILGKITNILSQKSYIAAQSSMAFTCINDDILISKIVNSYSNIQRMIGGSLIFGKSEPVSHKKVLIAYIKLCERSKEYIKSCILAIDEELKKVDKKLTILE